MSEPRSFSQFRSFLTEDADVLATLRAHLPKTTEPRKTRFILPDGTRLATPNDEPHGTALRTLGYLIKQATAAGAVRYVPFVGIETHKLTDAQAKVIADDFLFVFEVSCVVDYVNTDDQITKSREFHDPQADTLRYFVNAQTEDVQMAVASANLQSFRYDETTNTLTIRFRSGGVYRYANVPADVVDEMRWAESRGRYFWRYIRTNYHYTQLEAPRPGFTHAHNTGKHTTHLRHTLKVPKFTHKLPRLT